MDIVKKNFLSILCGVVALLGMIAIFWPIGPMVAKADATLEERKTTHEKIKALLPPSKGGTANRTLPTIFLDDREPPPLPNFPNEKVIEAGERATKVLQKQAADMLDRAVKLNAHEPLYKPALPKASGTANITFRNAYLDRLEEYIPNEVLKAGVPPTDDEIIEAAEKMWDEKFAERIVFIGEQAEPDTLESIQTEYLDAADKLPEQMRRQQAEKIRVYLSPEALVNATSPEVGRREGTPASEDIWYAQVGLWVVEDLANAIAAANAGTKEKPLADVTQAPVKQLVSIDIPFGSDQFVMRPRPVSLDGTDPSIDTGAEDAGTVPKDFALSPTGRVCNELFDVVHFTTILRVDARQIPLVLDELKRGRFITPIRVDVATVDAARALKEGYVYGEGVPVVDITVQCEALFLRRWTLPLMPARVQQTLGIQPKTDEEEEGDTGTSALAPGSSRDANG
jgi:hypothetical protein